jgi:L-threonylcarbamoyladenylate synthase
MSNIETPKVCKMLQDGGIIAFPTDTVFGLAVDAGNNDAVRKLFELKKRAREKALPIMIASIDKIDIIAQNISYIARELMHRYWPGPLTIVLERSSQVSPLVTGGGDTVAVRIPDHPTALKILRSYGKPLAVTSANISGESEIISAVEVKREFGNKVDLILPGKVKHLIASTVVDCTVDPPVILRKGILELPEFAVKIAKD